MERLRYGLVSPTATYWALYVAQAKGFFKEEGIEVQPMFTGGTLGGLQALLEDRVDVSAHMPDVVIAGIEEGADLAIIGGVNKLVASIVTQPQISSFAQLRGKRVALSRKPTGTALFFQWVLRQKGLREGDYERVEREGTSPELRAALLEGRVDAAMLSQPFDFEVMERGFHRLALTSQVEPDYPFATLNVRRTWAHSQRHLLVRFLRAKGCAGLWLYDASHKAEAIQILASATGLPKKYAEATYHLYLEETRALPRQGELSLVGLTRVQELMAQEGLLKKPLSPLEKYLEPSFLEGASTALGR